MSEMILPAPQADNEPAPGVDFTIGEKVITVTQQVPIMIDQAHTSTKVPKSTLQKILKTLW